MYKNLLAYAIRSFCSKLFYITLKKDNKVNLFQKFMLEKSLLFSRHYQRLFHQNEQMRNIVSDFVFI